jgi:hypothetical protein
MRKLALYGAILAIALPVAWVAGCEAAVLYSKVSAK